MEDTDMPAPRDGVCGDAALYLLGMLGDREAEDFLAHAGACAVCREELGALRVAVDVLGSSVPQLAAPEGVKRRVMEGVRGAGPRGAGPSPSVGGGRRGWRPLGPRPRGWRPRIGLRRLAPALVALGLLAGGVAIGVSSGRSGESTRAVRADVAIAGASAVLHDSGGHEWLTIDGLPEPRRGRVYELWTKRDGGSPRPTSSLFSPTRAGAATVAVPGHAGEHGVVMVTEEPGGGSARPTSAPVIVARL